jgi:aspartyl aminopeptidase
MKDQLKSNGFNEIKEIEKWDLVPGQSYYYTRNQSTIVAFTLGNNVK